MVTIQYIESTEDVLPMVGFNNKDINISPSLNQKILQKEREGRMSEVSTEKSNRSARGELKNMSDEEVQELLKLKKKQ